MIRLRVKELAKERNLSMSRLSRLADVSYKTIKRMFDHPDESFNTMTLDKVAKALNLPLTDLFEQASDNHS
jgi:DNA-binding Xre family transcriptional regulator